MGADLDDILGGVGMRSRKVRGDDFVDARDPGLDRACGLARSGQLGTPPSPRSGVLSVLPGFGAASGIRDSNSRSAVPRACVSVAWRGSRSCGTVSIARATSCARGPLMRTTPIPAGTGAVARATIVSVGENTATAYTGLGFGTRDSGLGIRDSGSGISCNVILAWRGLRSGPRTWPIGVSLQNASEGPRAWWGDGAGPRLPPTEPRRCVLPAA